MTAIPLPQMRANDWALLVILSILWGGSFFFVSVALTALPPLTIVWLRVGLSALALAVVLRVAGVRLPPRAAWGALLVMGCLNNVVPFTCFAIAQGRITGGMAAILNATTPLLTVIVAHLATRDERITRNKAIGLGSGFAGVIVMMAGQGADGQALAMALCLAAAMSYALAGVFGRRLRVMGVAPLQAALGQVTAATVILLPVWLWRDTPWALAWPGAHVAGAVVAGALLSTALAYLIYFRLLATAGATNLALVTFMIPVSATALGALILGDAVLPRHLAGFALIAAGLWWIQRRTAA